MPSRRQAGLTLLLVAAVVAAGVVLLATRGHPASPPGGSSAPSHGGSPGTSPAATPAPTTSTPSSLPENGGPDRAVAVEMAIYRHYGGCWAEAEPGNPDGAYRQDYHYPSAGTCSGGGWDLDVQVFATSSQARAAVAKVTASRAVFLAGNSLVVVADHARPAVVQEIATQPGVRQLRGG